MASTPPAQSVPMPAVDKDNGPYNVILALDPYLHQAFQSISSHTCHIKYSFEEIRLMDYAAGRISDSRHMKLGYVMANLNTHASLGHKIIVFEVDKSPAQKFSVHEDIVLPRSEFVRLGLKPEWKEGIERAIPLPDDHPHVFALYQHWLYNNAIDFQKNGLRVDPTDEYEILVKAYIFGDKILDLDFKDAVLYAIVEKLRVCQCFDLRLTSLLYENTLPQSQMRRLWIHVYYFAGKANWLDEEYAGKPLHPDFVMDFCRFQALRRMGFGALDDMSGVCNYHEHGDRRYYRHKAH